MVAFRHPRRGCLFNSLRQFKDMRIHDFLMKKLFLHEIEKEKEKKPSSALSFSRSRLDRTARALMVYYYLACYQGFRKGRYLHLVGHSVRRS